MKMRQLAWSAIRLGDPDVTVFDYLTPIVIQTSEDFHGDSVATMFEVFYHVISEDTDQQHFEDDMIALLRGTSLMPGGYDFASHGATGDFDTVFGPVFAAWYPTAGAC